MQKNTKLENLDPRKLFLLDGFGALLSAFLLGIILVQYESVFGIPKSTLYFLAIIPCFFVIFDFYSYSSKKPNLSNSLKVIAYLNFAYCLISICSTLFHFNKITIWGWGYIIIEVIIVSAIAAFELKKGRSLQNDI